MKSYVGTVESSRVRGHAAIQKGGRQAHVSAPVFALSRNGAVPACLRAVSPTALEAVVSPPPAPLIFFSRPIWGGGVFL